jgi:glycosyltransferase involved in cell wall biosynthesis
MSTTIEARNQTFRISVCVGTYRRSAGLARLLDALRPQIEDRKGRELVVVNDGSHDAAYEAVAAKHRNWMSYHARPQNEGIASVRNHLAQYAQGEFILYTDDDCAPSNCWVDWADAVLTHNPHLDVLAGTTKGLFDGREGLLGRTWAHYGLIPWPQFTPDFQRFVTACVAIRRALLLEAGGFRVMPAWGGVGEDSDLSRRLSARGARMRLDDNWWVHHDVSDSWRTQLRRFRSYGLANAAMNHLSTNPGLHEDVMWLSRKDHWKHRQRLWAQMRQHSTTFSKWSALRLISAAIATTVHMAYRDGLAAGAQRNRDRLGI